jgi:solute carrier family 27 fatty acid transporter 1/4
LFFPGLPKAAFITQSKAVGIGGVMLLGNVDADDVLYTSLPLYHSSGGGLGLFTVLLTGKALPSLTGHVFSRLA